jgi:hypothetical protein
MKRQTSPLLSEPTGNEKDVLAALICFRFRNTADAIPEFSSIAKFARLNERQTKEAMDGLAKCYFQEDRNAPMCPLMETPKYLWNDKGEEIGLYVSFGTTAENWFANRLKKYEKAIRWMPESLFKKLWIKRIAKIAETASYKIGKLN